MRKCRMEKQLQEGNAFSLRKLAEDKPMILTVLL